MFRLEVTAFFAASIASCFDLKLPRTVAPVPLFITHLPPDAGKTCWEVRVLESRLVSVTGAEDLFVTERLSAELDFAPAVFFLRTVAFFFSALISLFVRILAQAF